MGFLSHDLWGFSVEWLNTNRPQLGGPTGNSNHPAIETTTDIDDGMTLDFASNW
jgi:hypothetical protein